MKRLAVLGPAYSHSHLLAKKKSQKILLCPQLEKVFSAIREGKTDEGIVPLESMRFGTVRESIFALLQYHLKILKAYHVPIVHCLAAQGKEFQKIASHPQALAQCPELLQGKEVIECTSTSQAMQLAAQHTEIAALGAPEAAHAYGLKILCFSENENKTKFIRIGKKGIPAQGREIQTSLILNPKVDLPGLLFHSLAPFATQHINLVKIESLPSGKKLGSYLFYVELQGSILDKKIQAALDFLRHSLEITVLGSYEVKEL